MHQYQERDGEEDRQPGGKTCGDKCGGRIGQDKVEERLTMGLPPSTMWRTGQSGREVDDGAASIYNVEDRTKWKRG